jgi:two-component system cell cycle response regulator
VVGTTHTDVHYAVPEMPEDFRRGASWYLGLMMPNLCASGEEATGEISVNELRQQLEDGEQDQMLLTCVSEPCRGRIFTVKSGVNILGRAVGADICIPAASVSRLHAQIAATAGNYVLTDLGSTHGTMCDGEPVLDSVVLHHGSRIVVGGAVILVFCIEDAIERRMRSTFYELATRDPLTNAHNRRFFSERLESEWPWAVRHAKPCALLVLDLDHFKRVNDTWGHRAGDKVLGEFARAVTGAIRGEDVFARVGGDEFALLCRVTDLEQASALAERIRALVEGFEVGWNSEHISTTVSIGVATSMDPGVESPEALVQRADERLYAAKAEGRNQVAAERGHPSSSVQPIASGALGRAGER